MAYIYKKNKKIIKVLVFPVNNFLQNTSTAKQAKYW